MASRTERVDTPKSRAISPSEGRCSPIGRSPDNICASKALATDKCSLSRLRIFPTVISPSRCSADAPLDLIRVIVIAFVRVPFHRLRMQIYFPAAK